MPLKLTDEKDINKAQSCCHRNFLISGFKGESPFIPFCFSTFTLLVLYVYFFKCS